MSLELVAQGTDLVQASGADAGLAEGSAVEFQVGFRYRFPLFGQLAGEVDQALRLRGVPPWDPATPLVQPDPSAPLWRIRYAKGFPWLAVIVGVLVALALLVVYWKVLVRVARVVAGAAGWALALAGLGLLGYAVSKKGWR